MNPMRWRAVALAAALGLCLGVLAGSGPAPSLASLPASLPALTPSPQQSAVGALYHAYVVTQVFALQATTRRFTDAVRGGDVAAAKAAYVPTRQHYARIECVTEALDDYGDHIDRQVEDAPSLVQWTGFHRIEKALWVDGSLAGMTPYANELDLDVEALRIRATRLSFGPVDVGRAAADLLTPMSTTTVQGLEDRYAHTDLWDLAAGIEGARTAFDLLQPMLANRDPSLVALVDARFAVVDAALDTHREGGGYVDYSTVTAPERRTLAEALDGLAEPLSQIAAAVS